MYEAVFTVNGTSAYEAATAADDTTIELWCNDHCDLLVVTGDADGSVDREVNETVGIDQRLDRNGDRVLVTRDCLKDHLSDNIEQYVRRHDCLLLPPLKYIAGAKRARVLALDADSLSAFYADVAGEFEVQVESKRSLGSIRPDSPFLPISAMLPEFTDRQRAALTTAYDQGYYEIPRETTTADIAAELGVHRRTAEDHLRVAERKLVAAFIDYL